MTNIILIAIFGIAGILFRYGIDSYLGGWNEVFPASTFAINLLGSFLAGSIYAFSVHRDISTNLQTALLVGFCGGFTTFSAYALQTVLMFERGKFTPAMLYFFITPALGLLAAFIPVFLARKLFV